MQATRGAPLAERGQNPTRGPILALAVTAALALACDAVSKAEVVRQLRPGRPVHVVGDVLELLLTRNSGAAFSIGPGATVLFSLLAVFVVVVIVRTARRLRSRAWGVTLGLLLGGALGNLADRLFRAPGPLRGHVVDWIALPHWPVFNIADSAITIGAVIAVVLALAGVPLTPPAQPADPEPVAPDRAGTGR